MGSKRHDDRSSRMGNRNDPRGNDPRGGAPRSSEPDRGAPGRVFDRSEDMGGSGWSGASGRGGMSYEGSGYAASNRGYGREGGYAGERGYGHEHGHEGGYPGDRRTTYEQQRSYPDDRRFGHGHEGSYASSSSGYTSYDSGARRDDAGFIQERGFGHVPGQRWSGGYGGDRDRDRGGYEASGPGSGRGFTGNDFGGAGGRDLGGRDTGERDFGGLPRQRDRQLGAPADMSREQRHFGNPVDRGGRMGPAASYGYRGTDMGMGAPDEDRGPHWGKGPKGYTRSDEKTREEVCEAIAHQGHIDASDVEVKVEKGIVVLSGTVAHRHQKRALEQLVEHVRGVHDVHNELRLTRNVAGGSRDARASAQSTQGDQNAPGNGHEHPKNGKIARA